MAELQSLYGTEHELARPIPTSRVGHIAVRIDDCFIITGGMMKIRDEYVNLPVNVIWVFNLHTEEWSNYLTPPDQETPEGCTGACGVPIARNILTFGRSNAFTRTITNELWILKTPLEKSKAQWAKIQMEPEAKRPSPRIRSEGWEYGGTLWVFGGQGVDISGYIDDHGTFIGGFNNQLLSFDPSTKKWTNPQCSGHVPSPRAFCATAVTDDKVWLYSGINGAPGYLSDMYMLPMDSARFVWTRIVTNNSPALQGICISLSPVSNTLVMCSYNDEQHAFEVRVFDKSSLIWTQARSISAHFASGHKVSLITSKGLNNDVICIGIQCTRTDTDNRTESKLVQQLVPQPRSLRQLSMRVTYRHRDTLAWQTLPLSVIDDLRIPEEPANETP